MSSDSADSKNEVPSRNSSTPSVSGKSVLQSRVFDQIRGWIIPLAALFVLAVVGGYLLTNSSSKLKNNSVEPDPLANQREIAPNVQMTKIDGGQLHLNDLRGKVLLLGFWAADCSTCLIELPSYNELLNRYRDEGLEVMAINIDIKEIGEKSATEIWARANFQMTSLIDAEKRVAAELKVETLPSAVILDRKGRVAFTSYGANDWQSSETTRLIEELLLEE